MLQSLLIALVILQASNPSPPAPPSQKAAEGKSDGGQGTKVANATPEEAYRTFFLVMITKDEKTLRAVTLPHDDFDWLLKGVSPPEGQLDAIKDEIAKMKIRVLKPGDEITLPRGRKMTISETDVTDDRAVLLPEGAPLPTRCRKIDGRWRVDASAIIAGRKAADAASKKDQGR